MTKRKVKSHSIQQRLGLVGGCFLCLGATLSLAQPPAGNGANVPATSQTRDFTPRPKTFVEPQPLSLPTSEALKTIHLKDRTYNIKRVSGVQKDKDSILREGLAAYEKTDEALRFVGSGGAGRKSRERLIVEDCTFVIDFQEGDFETWNPLRSGIFVTGYNEVLIRNCIFLVKGYPGEPDRRTMASVGIYDTQKVQIEECYFEGLTNWMRGHVTIFDSGATTIRRVEVSGTKLGDQWWSGGGLWIANGLGEGKLGSAQEMENKIYPSGPLLIEDCYVHDQQGNENTDGIYIQSIHPYVVRNCRVERWGKDGLMDLGFRDSASRSHDGKPLVNHGTIGLVENCDFAEGYIKCSVGLGGGLILRNNRMKNVWLYPYIFDGGSWYVLNNEFSDQRSVLLSGRDDQLSGWSAKEGMFANGSKMYWYGNTIQSEGAPKALYVSSGAKPSNLRETVVADYNIYKLGKNPGVWGDDQSQGAKYSTLEEWRAIGNDRNSIIRSANAGTNPAAAAKLPPLPGGVQMNWNAARGVTQTPVGVNATLRNRAQELSKAYQDEFGARNRKLEFEALTMQPKVPAEARAWASGGQYLVFAASPEKPAIQFTVNSPQPARFQFTTRLAPMPTGGVFQLEVNGAPLGEAVDFSNNRIKSATHGIATLKSGDNSIAYRLVKKGDKGAVAQLDVLELKDATLVEKRAADAENAADAKARQRAEQARLDALKVKLDIATLPINGRPQTWNYDRRGGGQYRLWGAKGINDSITFRVAVEKAGEYSVGVTTTAQADKGELALAVDGTEIGRSSLGGSMRFGTVNLAAGEHQFKFTLTGPAAAGATKVRFSRIELTPLDKNAAP